MFIKCGHEVVFEMPAPGYLGFVPFAVECFVMYVTAGWLLRWPARAEKSRLSEERE